mmetsp:Transcript_14458/g.34186  ORF Transcript_14458/g.34186 Transcript_14458/m.34186 type:complete len:91 (+) Transcript_14458:277-549(+)
MGPVPWLMMGEIFPASIRSPACGLAALVNWSSGFVVTFFFDDLQSLVEPQGCFLFFAAVCFIAAFFALLVLPETKGKTFEMIANELRGNI